MSWRDWFSLEGSHVAKRKARERGTKPAATWDARPAAEVIAEQSAPDAVLAAAGERLYQEARERTPPRYRDLLEQVAHNPAPYVRMFLHCVCSEGFLTAALAGFVFVYDREGHFAFRGCGSHTLFVCPESRVRALLCDGIRDPHPQTRARAIQNMGQVTLNGDYGEDDLLHEALRDPAEHVRWHAALQMGRLAPYVPDAPGLATVLLDAAGKDLWFTRSVQYGEPPLCDVLYRLDEEVWSEVPHEW